MQHNMSENKNKREQLPINERTLDSFSDIEQAKIKEEAMEYTRHLGIISKTLKKSYDSDAQDILLQSGETPLFKVAGIRQPVHDLEFWTNETFDIFIRTILMSGQITNEPVYKDEIIKKSESYKKALNTAETLLNKRNGTYDFNLSFKSNNFRCHLISATPKGMINNKLVNRQINLNIRVVPKEMPELDNLHLPSQVQQIFREKSGLVLVSGSTGDGKSTTVASIIHKFNSSNDKYRTILTIEEPIEFLHKNDNAYIIQRNLSSLPTDDLQYLTGDVLNYEKATEDALREDCDIVMIGELRTESAMHNALRLVEAGKLVIASIHGRSVPDTIEKFLGEFKLDDFEKTKNRLASNLLCIIHQNLVLKDSQQYPLASVLFIANHSEMRNELKSILVDKVNANKPVETKIENLMESSVTCITKKQRFDEMVKEGIFTNEDEVRFF